MMDDAQVKHMVDRFLCWKLPEHFAPDAGISFDPVYNKGSQHEGRHQPVGTNLFCATQAEEMVRHMLEDLPSDAPIPMILNCPSCGARHIDEGEFAEKVHRDHACQGCGLVWRPAKVPTVGVHFLPGYSNAEARSA
jgi:rubredoxin